MPATITDMRTLRAIADLKSCLRTVDAAITHFDTPADEAEAYLQARLADVQGDILELVRLAEGK